MPQCCLYNGTEVFVFLIHPAAQFVYPMHLLPTHPTVPSPTPAPALHSLPPVSFPTLGPIPPFQTRSSFLVPLYTPGAVPYSRLLCLFSLLVFVFVFTYTFNFQIWRIRDSNIPTPALPQPTSEQDGCTLNCGYTAICRLPPLHKTSKLNILKTKLT